MKVLSLFVRHGTEKYADAHEKLRAYYASRLPQVDVTCVIVDNSLPEGEREDLGGGVLLLGASNALWEFSAWDSALKTLAPTLMRYDFIHFVTSAYFQLYTAYIDRIDAAMLSSLRGRDVVLGHIDAYGDPVGFLGCSSQAWLRSSFLFSPPAVIRRLGAITTFQDSPVWFSGNISAPFRDNVPASEKMQSMIISWLTGQGTGQGTVWHSRFDLTPETLQFFEAKTLAVLNEHALSLRILAQGSSLVDATWMSAILQGAVGPLVASLTDWRAQLSERGPFI